MLTLLAAALEDGWAFVKDGTQIRLIRPPFKKNSCFVVPERTVEKAVHSYNFAFMEHEFADWLGLVKFLKEQLIEARKAKGQIVPTLDSIKDVLHYAPSHTLIAYLNRIESELLPNHEFDAAEDLLITLINLDSVRDDKVLLSRATAMLRRCKDEWKIQNDKQNLLNNNPPLRDQFPHIERHYSIGAVQRRAEEVRETQRIMG